MTNTDTKTFFNEDAFLGSLSGEIWLERAKKMVIPVLAALKHLDSVGKLKIDIETLRLHLNLISIIDLSNNEDVSDSIRNDLRVYLNSVPGYNENLGHFQIPETFFQHFYLETTATINLLKSSGNELYKQFEERLAEFYKDTEPSMWRDRSMVLLRSIFPFADSLFKEGKLRYENDFQKWFGFDAIDKLLSQDFPKIWKDSFTGYLHMAPGFRGETPNKEQIARQHHNMLLMTLSPVFKDVLSFFKNHKAYA